MSHSNENATVLARLDELERFCRSTFLAAGTDDETADAATRAMMHGTRLGVDSHGVRLLAHYITALEGGRLNRRPQIRRVSGFGAVETIDADHAHGARATYARLYGGLPCRDGSEMAYRFNYAENFSRSGKCPVPVFPSTDSAFDW